MGVISLMGKPRWQVSGRISVDFCVEVEAGSADEAEEMVRNDTSLMLDSDMSEEVEIEEIQEV
jgi:hypothetical protein